MKQQYVVGFPFLVQSPMEHVEDRQFVYLMKKKKPSWQFDKLNGIGGKVEKGEKPLDAMIREANEEATGLEESNWLHVVTISHQNCEVHYYRTDVLPENKVSAKEDEPIILVHTEKLPANVIKDVTWILRFAKFRHCYNPMNDIVLTAPYM